MILYRNVNHRNNYFLNTGLVFIITACMCTVFFIINNIYPFGDRSLLIWDENIQYVDFFRWYKRVLAGEESIIYSFSKSLGGSFFALWGFCLASPLNLFLIFISEEHIYEFLILASILKVALSGTAFSIYLQIRFRNLKKTWVIILSMAYAMSQYMVSQISNIQWLDGVYMLPVIMAGVYIWTKDRKPYIFCISIALSIMFNWYTGYMNCIFAMIYFCYEYSFFENKFCLSKIIKDFVYTCFVELIGVGLSCIVFVPIVLGQAGGRSAFDSGIFNFNTNGTLFDILKSFTIGIDSPGIQIALYFSLILFLIVFLYFQSHINKRETITNAIFLSVMLSTVYFAPIEHVFVGFKFETSYQYRFSYLIICAFLLVAAQGIQNIDLYKKSNCLKVGGLYILFLLFIDSVSSFNDKILWLNIGFIFIYCILLYLNPRWKETILIILCFIELVCNAYLVTLNDYTGSYEAYKTYTKEQKQLIENLKKYDEEIFHESSLFRTEQNFNREFRKDLNSFHNNENMAYGFYGIQHYSSSYDLSVSSFVKKLGYCDGEFPTFYHEPILSSDSLLGVKYFLSDNEYLGFNTLEDVAPRNGKTVYINPFALPLAFSVNTNIIDVADNTNPFEYQNGVFSALLGEPVEIFKPVASSYFVENKSLNINTVADNKEDILYGYTRKYIGISPLYIDGCYKTDYQSGWQNWSVFYIGASNQDHMIEFKNYTNGIENPNSIIYKLDMDTFSQAINTLKQGAIKNIDINPKGKIDFTYDSKDTGAAYIFLSIPWDEGWHCQVNGEKVDIISFADALMFIPVEQGINNVQLTYKAPGIKLGAVISIASIMVLVGYRIYTRRKVYRGRDASKDKMDRYC